MAAQARRFLTGVATAPFEPAAYWRRRAVAGADLGIVGHRALGREYNAYIYRRRIEVLNECLAGMFPDPTTVRVLDVGAGSGFYLDYWRQRGVARVLGVDVSPDAVASLASRFPQFRIQCADVTVPGSLDTIGNHFDVITLFDVLYHVTQDDAAQTAFQVLSELLAPEGRLLIFDHIMRRNYSLRRHVRFRGKDTYSLLLREAKLEIVNRIPLFSVLEPPLFGVKPVDVAVSGAYRVLGVFWRGIPSLGRFAGKAAYRFDAWLRKRGVQLPNHELLVMRRIPERA